MYQTNLLKIKEFNPALIYGFEPESTNERLAGMETCQYALFPEAGQYVDMLNAYLYAQDVILPFIRTSGMTEVTEPMFLGWLNTLHRLIGKTLLKSLDTESGNYSERFIFRWHHGSQLNSHFIQFLSGMHPCRTDSSFIRCIHEELGVDKNEAMDFLQLLRTFQNNTAIAIPANQQKFLQESPAFFQKAISGLNKLYVAYRTGFLKPQEKAIMNKMLKVCLFPEQIPEAMQAYAKETLRKYAACDKTNLQEVTQFLAESFYHLTGIHPYPNANGRVATCLMNIFLRSFDFPSVLLRHPGDRENAASQYSIAFDKIDVSRKPLQQLLVKRINDARISAFSNPQLAKIIELRVSLSELLQRILKKHSSFNCDALFQQVMVGNVAQINTMDDDSASLFALGLVKDLAILAEQKLDLDKSTSFTSLHKPLDEADKAALIASLEQISGQHSWKVNQQKGLIAWIEIPDMEDAMRVQALLKETNMMNAILSKRKDNDVPVIKCDQINHQKLMELTNKQMSPSIQGSLN